MPVVKRSQPRACAGLIEALESSLPFTVSVQVGLRKGSRRSSALCRSEPVAFSYMPLYITIVIRFAFILSSSCLSCSVFFACSVFSCSLLFIALSLKFIPSLPFSLFRFASSSASSCLFCVFCSLLIHLFKS